jgi:pentatricopeptide repeat protein
MQNEIVEVMSKDNVPMTPQMVHMLLEGMNKNHEEERASMLFRDMRKRGVRPRLHTWNYMILHCVENRDAEEAVRMLLDFKETEGEESVPDHIWWNVLESSAKSGLVESLSILLI